MDVQVCTRELLETPHFVACRRQKSHGRLQAHYRQDADSRRVGTAGENAPPKSELTFSLQNFQVDNQLLNASMPVVICRREMQAADREVGNQGLLKAAQREIERQRQGAPLLTVHCKRILSNGQETAEDSVVIKCVSLEKQSFVHNVGCA